MNKTHLALELALLLPEQDSNQISRHGAQAMRVVQMQDDERIVLNSDAKEETDDESEESGDFPLGKEDTDLGHKFRSSAGTIKDLRSLILASTVDLLGVFLRNP